ncbi:hypothetical protein MMC17_004192 [Xylographa soralifera]|nr:hypothetical protein [Xylographa soralifera]
MWSYLILCFYCIECGFGLPLRVNLTPEVWNAESANSAIPENCLVAQDINDDGDTRALMHRLSELLGRMVGASIPAAETRLNGPKASFVDGDADNLRGTTASVPSAESGHSSSLCRIRQISSHIYIDDAVPESHKVFTTDTMIDHVHVDEVATDPQTGWLLFDVDGRPMMTSGFEQEAGWAQNLCTERAIKRNAEINIKVWSSNDRSSWTSLSAKTIAAETRTETEVWAMTQQYSSHTQVVENIVAVEDVSSGSNRPTSTAPPLSTEERIEEEEMVDTSVVPATYTTSYESIELLTNPSSQSLVTIATPVVLPFLSSSPSRPSELSVLASLTSQVVPATFTDPTSEELAVSILTLAISQPQPTTLITSDLKTEFSDDRESTTQAASTPTGFRLSYVSSVNFITILAIGSTSSSVILAKISREASRKGFATSTSTTSMAAIGRTSSLNVLHVSAAAFTSQHSQESSKTSESFPSTSISSRIASMTTMLVSADLSSGTWETSTMTATPLSVFSFSHTLSSSTSSENSSTTLVTMVNTISSTASFLSIAPTTKMVSKSMENAPPARASLTRFQNSTESRAPASRNATLTTLAPLAETPFPSSPPPEEHPSPQSPTFETTESDEHPDPSNDSSPLPPPLQELPPLEEHYSPQLPALETTGSNEHLNLSNDSSPLPPSPQELPLPEHIPPPESPSPQSSPAPPLPFPEDVPELVPVPKSPPPELVEPEALPEPLPPNLLSLPGSPLPEDTPLPESPFPQSSPAPALPFPENVPELVPLPKSLPPELVEPEALPEPLPPNLLSLPESPPPELFSLLEPAFDTSSMACIPQINETNQADLSHGDILPQPPSPGMPEAANTPPPNPPSPPPPPSQTLEHSPTSTSTITSTTPSDPPTLKGTTVYNPLTGDPIRKPNTTSPSPKPCAKPNPLTSLKPIVPNPPYRDPSAGKFDIPSLKPVPKPSGTDADVGGGTGDWRAWKAVNSSHFDPWTGEHVHAGREA